MVDLIDSAEHCPAERSGGIWKRAAIAPATALRPDYILFDEPTTGLDPITTASIRVRQGLDTLMTRIQKGQETLARLTTDSTVYPETTAALAELRALVADIRVNLRKYFRFRVF